MNYRVREYRCRELLLAPDLENTRLRMFGQEADRVPGKDARSCGGIPHQGDV